MPKHWFTVVVKEVPFSKITSVCILNGGSCPNTVTVDFATLLIRAVKGCFGHTQQRRGMTMKMHNEDNENSTNRDTPGKTNQAPPCDASGGTCQTRERFLNVALEQWKYPHNARCTWAPARNDGIIHDEVCYTHNDVRNAHEWNHHEMGSYSTH